MKMDENSVVHVHLARLIYERLIKEVKAYETEKNSADVDFIRRWGEHPLVRSFFSEDELTQVDRVNSLIMEPVYKRIIEACKHDLN